MPCATHRSARHAAASATRQPELRAGRAATALVFFLTGAVFATWAARLPTLTERLALSPGETSVALVGVEAGALGGLAVAGRLVGAFGSASSLRGGFAVYPAALVATALAPSLSGLAVTMAVMGIANSVIDVAMNVQGVELERRHARPLLSGLHSAHSFGVVAGGLGGTICAGRAIPLTAHFAVVAGTAFLAAQLGAGSLLSERRAGADRGGPVGRRRADADRGGPVGRRRADADRGGPVGRRREDADAGADAGGRVGRRQASTDHGGRLGARRRGSADRGAPPARRRLAALGLLAAGAFFVEGAANNWSAIELRAVHGAGAGLAGAAFTTFSLALALARLAADRLVARHGRERFVRAAALVAAVGAALVVVSGSAGAALLGWAVVGAGVAGIAPTLLGAAPGVSAVAPATAIASVSALGYVGSFAGPPVIGGLASLTSLPAALASLALGAGAIALFARSVLGDGRRAAH